MILENEIGLWFFKFHKLPKKKISYIYYLPNDSPDAASNVIVVYDGVLYCILKSWKNKNIHKRAINQVAKLSGFFSFSGMELVREKAVSPRVVTLCDNQYIYQRFIYGGSGYFSAKMSSLMNNSRSLRSLVDYVYRLGFKNEYLESDLNQIKVKPLDVFEIYSYVRSSPLLENYPAWAKAPDCANFPSAQMGLVHYDLAPSNVLISKKTYKIIDWEFADISYSIFNVFDLILSFGSFLITPVYKKRNDNSYLDVLRNVSMIKNKSFFLEISELVAFNCDARLLNLHNLEYLFKAYLASKSVCQFRIYGSHSNLDKFWIEMAVKFEDYQKDFYAFWACILELCEKNERKRVRTNTRTLQ